ncbi:hypothetical protein EJ02DRAFT_452356 [Clathrospora elynae]|uniref:Uncharacterized protein n=1 Tax=Clathrospora elynae TaxID=706981 RepID=A0A6A5SXP0_9PLEO|nr:hypothetical protein EJ02DRAFT_452356 [Clathrospora elynae]
MPRQLPWANKHIGKKQRVTPNLDDGFFDGTVLASDSKGKGRAEEFDDDDLPDLPAEPSTPYTNSRTKDAISKKRAPSSSPPPVADLEQPRVEGMYKGVSKFDLRDDEWMMVEDEFLDTAKLFTRHLHMAEYERLKERIEEKKKEAEVVRPVVLNAKMSVDGAIKKKVKFQEKKQRMAIQDVFASQNDEDEEEDSIPARTSFSTAASAFSRSGKPATTVLKWPPNALAARDSDSDDLDVPRPASKPVPRATSFTTLTSAPIRTTAVEPKSASSHAATTKASEPTFAKPALPPAASKSRSRLNRATPFDMLDDYVPKKSQTTPKASPDQTVARTPQLSRPSSQSSSPIKPSATSGTTTTIVKARRSVDSFDGLVSSKGQASEGVSKESAADRIARRKAQRERDEKEKKQEAVTLDDIPTFLF